MSYKTPIEHTITSPILLDERIKMIQSKMTELSWLTYAFGRAYKHYKTLDDARVVYPAVYQSATTDYYNCFPNDNNASYSFVYVRQPQDQLSASNGRHNYSTNISIIVLARLDKINTSKGYYFLEELKYDVSLKLEELPWLVVNQVFDEIEEAYSDFTTAAIESEYLSENTGALRFDCTIKYSNDCKITNTY